MAIQTPDNSPRAILQRLDVVLHELLTLRQVVQTMVQEEPKEDIVSALAGSLGPSSSGEAEYFNTFDVTWQRFADEQDDQSI